MCEKDIPVYPLSDQSGIYHLIHGHENKRYCFHVLGEIIAVTLFLLY